MVGRYKLLERIGEGGFGVVYMAEQQHPVRRRVALKLIKPGVDTRQVIARFEAERQALAMMDHENIAKVFDAGATDAGRPYFVMELVHGVPITDYCDKNRLPPRERLGLFVRVCRAVQHAPHQGRHPPRPQADQRPGDPARRGRGAEGDRLRRRQGDRPAADRADAVHAVRPDGRHAAVHEPRAGGDERPGRGHAQRRLQPGRPAVRAADRHHARSTASGSARAALDEVRRIIREEEPPKPSTRLSTFAGAELSSISRHLRTEPKKLGQLVRGELDWIVMKCLEKDRVRRYETVDGLAADVRRYLNDEPIQARPPGTLYRLRISARRHKVAMGAGAAVVTALVIGLGAATYGLILRPG